MLRAEARCEFDLSRVVLQNVECRLGVSARDVVTAVPFRYLATLVDGLVVKSDPGVIPDAIESNTAFFGSLFTDLGATAPPAHVDPALCSRRGKHCGVAAH